MVLSFMKKNLCNLTNFKLIVIAVLLLNPLGWQLDVVRNKSSRIKMLLDSNITRGNCQNPDSPLSYLNLLYK